MSRHDKPLPKIGFGSPETPEDDGQLQIDVRLNLDDVAAAEEVRLRLSARRRPSRQDLQRIACKIFDARKARAESMGNALFGEPAWDMLLALYCLPSRGHLQSPSTLVDASEVHPTTAVRWLKHLQRGGYVEQGPSGVAERRQFMRLTTKGRSLMERYLIRLFYCDAQLPPDD